MPMSKFNRPRPGMNNPFFKPPPRPGQGRPAVRPPRMPQGMPPKAPQSPSAGTKETGRVMTPSPLLRSSLASGATQANAVAGGTNAVGTATGGQAMANYAGRPGFFQYSPTQWGYINRGGTINWTANAPRLQGGRYRNPIVAYGGVAQHARTSGQMGSRPAVNRPLPYYADVISQQKISELRHGQGMAERQAKYDIAQAEGRYKDLMNTLVEQFAKGGESRRADMGSRGLYGSGLRYAEDIRDTQEHAKRTREAGRQYGGDYQTKLRQDLRAKSQQAKAQESFELQRALQRNIDAPKSRKLKPYKKGFFQQGGAWFYRNPQGIVISARRPRRR